MRLDGGKAPGGRGPSDFKADIYSPTTSSHSFFTLFCPFSLGDMLRLPLSFILFLLASTATYTVAQRPGSFVDGGNTLVSAMMVSIYFLPISKTKRLCADARL